MLSVFRIRELPQDIGELSVPAAGEALQFVTRLVEEFQSGENRFTGQGEALFEVRLAGKLVAIGGLNIDPYVSDRSVGRVRRTYVHPAHRSRGIGRLLLETIENHARGRFEMLRLRPESEAASRFYIRAGFNLATDVSDVSHIKALSGRQSC
jgi:GNAT superfamily N-acetyltransferase